MSDSNFVFFVMGLRYNSCLMMVWRKPIISSDLYGGLMEAVTEVEIVVDPCASMMSTMGEIVDFRLVL